MPPTVRSSSQYVNSANVTTQTVPKPSGTAEGDLIVIIISTNQYAGRASIIAPSGFPAFTWIGTTTNNANYPSIGVTTKAAGSSEPSGYAIGMNNNLYGHALTCLALIPAAGTGTPVLDAGPVGSTTTTASTTATIPAVTAGVAGTLEVGVVASNSQGGTINYGTPSGWTVAQEIESSAAWAHIGVYSRALASSGSSGTSTSSQSSSKAYTAAAMTFKNGPAAPVEPTWAPAMTGGTVTWSADMTQADSVAAGYTDDSWQRQTASGPMGDTTVEFPVPTLPAPFGRPGRAMRIRVPDGYKRHEVVPDTPALVDGDSVFIGFSFLLEPDVDTVATAGNYFQSIWQLRPDDSTGSPPVGLEVIEEAIELSGGYGRPNPAGGTFTNEQQYRVRIFENPSKGRWINVVMFLGVWSELNSGRVDVWIDGVQVVTNYRPKPGTNFGTLAGTSYPKNGVYHDGANPGATVWFADHKHGTSYAAVDPTRTIAAYGDVVAEP